MAIDRKNTTTNNAAQSKYPVENQRINKSADELKTLLENLERNEAHVEGNDERINELFNPIIRDLVAINVPINAGEIKDFRNDLMLIGRTLERILRTSDNAEQIYIGCLQTLYSQLVKYGK